MKPIILTNFRTMDMVNDTIENIIICDRFLKERDSGISMTLCQYALKDLKRNIDFFNQYFPQSDVTTRFNETYASLNALYQLKYGLDIRKP